MVKRAVIDGERNQQRHSLKPTRATLLCPWEKHFTALSPALWS